MAYALYVEGAATSVYLDGSTGNLKLAKGSWRQKSSEGDLVWEVFDLIGFGTDAGIRTDLANLAKIISDARDNLGNAGSPNATWLYFQSEGESSKRALVFDGHMEIMPRDILTPMLGNSRVYVRVAIQRHPLWENPTYTTDSGSGLSTLGGATNLPTTGMGSAPGRFGQFRITLDDPESNPITRLWCGIRPNYDGGGITSHEPLWEAEDGSTDDCTSTADGTASGGYKMVCSWGGGTDLHKILGINTIDVDLTPGDEYKGKYFVLCRAKVVGATDVLIQLRAGFQGTGDTAAVASSVYISNTVWDLHELGYMTIPNIVRDGVVDVDYYGLGLWAERVSGSGNLEIDCFVLIPAEHMFFAKVSGDIYSLGAIYVHQFSNDEYGGFHYDGASTFGNLEYGVMNWGMPFLGGYLVIAGAQLASHVLSVTVDMYTEIFPRWLSYRV